MRRFSSAAARETRRFWGWSSRPRLSSSRLRNAALDRPGMAGGAPFEMRVECRADRTDEVAAVAGRPDHRAAHFGDAVALHLAERGEGVRQLVELAAVPRADLG